MDRSLVQFNRYLSEKWYKEDMNSHENRLKEIASTQTKSSIPSQHDQLDKQQRLQRIFQLQSRKKQMEQEREEQIKKENRALYVKMTEIIQDVAGNVAPKRNKRHAWSMINPTTDSKNQKYAQ